MEGLKQKVFKGTVWAALEKFGARAVSFTVTLVLARLLTPSDYGTVALITIFISIASVIADSGFGQALVQKKDADEVDFNSVFYLGIGWASAVYMVLFACAPAIARFYDNAELVPIVRVLGSILLFHSVNSVQCAELNRKLLFKLSFRVTLFSSIVHGVTGIILAFCGFGPWALVWGQFAAGVAQTVGFWLVIAWRPKLQFSWPSVLGLFRYGWKLTASELLNTGYNNLYGLVIGKLYTKEDLAFVNKGQSVPYLGMETINGTLGRVAFPAFAQLQSDPVKLREGMRRVIQCSSYFVFPLMTGCAICARSLVLIMFGERWLPCVPFVQLACFQFALWPFHTVNLNAISARGRSDIYLKLEIVKKLIGFAVLFVSCSYGVLTMMIATAVVGSPLGLILNMYPNWKHLGYTPLMQVRDVCSTIFACVVMGAVLFGVGCLLRKTPAVVCLVVQMFAGMMIYFSLSYAVRSRPMGEMLRVILPRFASFSPEFAKRVANRFAVIL